MHVAHKNQSRIDVSKKSDAIKELMMPAFEMLDKYEIPPEKHKGVFDYTVDLYSRKKHFSFERLVRKVVDHFKLKLKGA